MANLAKHWRPKQDPASHELIHQFGMYGISQVLAQVLINRGFNDPRTAQDFLRADRHASEPFNPRTRMKGIQEAVARIQRAIRERQIIVVYGDFDADGVTSTVLMVETLRALYRRRYPNWTENDLKRCVQPYIPKRVDEGYGLNNDALDKLKTERQAGLVITVDCGIRSVEEVKYGQSLQLDLIVTDHHSIGPDIPAAYAVINPKQTDCPYPEEMLAGVGVAYRLAEALVKAETVARRGLPPPIDLESLLDLVAIGTVADLAPLNSVENRALVRRGLKVINEGRRPGVRALLEVAKVNLGTVSAMNIGFTLGPRINAAGRLRDAMTACELLYTRDEARAFELAQQLQDLNVERQNLTRAAQEKIKASVEAIHDLPLIFAGDKDFQPGIVGLVAGRLVEEYFRPAVVMEYGETESRASCRSIPQFDITHALDECSELLVRHGGHAQAAGFTVDNRNLKALETRLLQLAETGLRDQDLRPMLVYDADVNINQLSEELLNELEQLEPTGHMNPSPVLMSRNVYVKECRTVGADGKHLKLKLACAGKRDLDAIGFNLGEWMSQMPKLVDVAYQLEMNVWNGSRSLQLNLQDIRPAEAPNGR